MDPGTFDEFLRLIERSIKKQDMEIRYPMKSN